jgi:V/A-type H+-transporting ATPase subunit I
MQLRPFAAQWFEVVVPKRDADDTMEALARHAEVQFEWEENPKDSATLDPLRAPLARFGELALHYARFWPAPAFPKRCCELPLEAEARIALGRIEQWLAAASPDLDRRTHLREEQELLENWRLVLDGLRASNVDLGRLARAGPALVGLCLILPAQTDPPTDDQTLTLDVPAGDQRIRLVLAPKSDQQRLTDEVRARGGRCLSVPACFRGEPRVCARNLASRDAQLQYQIRRLEQDLRRLALSHGPDRSIGVLQRIDWFLHRAPGIRCDDTVCWITGWTSTPDRSVLEGALKEVGVESPVMFRDPPGPAPSPSVTDYPLWMRPFEVFTRAVGVPGIREADPTTWVALLVPFLFGYMCGDVGHGLIIMVAGLLIRRRTELWPLLVFCGFAAVGFGFLYGGLFGYEHLIQPLWVRPLEEPLVVLAAPMVAGTLVLTLGIFLRLVETCWRGEAGSRGISDAAQILVYWGLLLIILDPRLGLLAVAGVLICAANNLRQAPTLAKIASQAGQLAQTTFGLLLNTLSFARVGAFALAHAALESTVATLADSTRILALGIFVAVLGNLVVILLEGLVVSSQTM